jgi:hypothetical protein
MEYETFAATIPGAWSGNAMRSQQLNFATPCSMKLPSTKTEKTAKE